MIGAVSTSPLPFGRDELLDRRRRLLRAAAEAGANTVIAYGANRTGGAVPWLTTWPVTREAVVLLRADRTADLLVGFPNHVPDARRTAAAAGLGDQVQAVDGDAVEVTVSALARHGLPGKVACVGPLPRDLREAVAGRTSGVVDLGRAYTELRMTKSAEEIGWLRHAAALTDAAAGALLDAAAGGASEQEMVAAAEFAYRKAGGTHHICYVCTTGMDDPDRCVPAQWPSDRRARPGSVVVFELSAGWGTDYPAQLLRTATVAAPPTPLYTRLHETAEAARDEILARLRAGIAPAELLAGLAPVREAGFVTVDDLVHGLGGGYLPPVLSERHAEPTGLDAQPLPAGSTLVVQPNVCTPDLRAGVQTGEMVVVTEHGYESLHQFPAGLLTLDPPRTG